MFWQSLLLPLAPVRALNITLRGDMLYLYHGYIVLSVHLTLVKMIREQSPEILGAGWENRFVTKELESIHKEDDIHELCLNPWHQRELDTVPGSELYGQGLLGQHPQVLLHLILTVAAVDVKPGDGSRPSLALNWQVEDG